MNALAQQIAVAIVIAAAAVYLAVACWRRAFGRGPAAGCGGCAKCPASATASEATFTDGKPLPLVSIDITSIPRARSPKS